ncbi:uncharacterized protein LOC100211951 isoform X1 [Hydra vulgaris]|uniref:uncharacterized protein LOC100211951 isoform X1 n=1 Tax=Hydra vulgaris TaxID=6087 RepID=UPI0006414E30|nr:uncharacterized protein LOC100211951 [Hydra vulgaris]
MSELKKKIYAIKVLGIIQVIISILSVALGISEVATANTNEWSGNSGAGIWGGIWIGITGILGILLASSKNNNCLNGTHLSFCIITMVVTWINGIIYIAFISYTNNCWSLDTFSGYRFGCNYKFSAARGISGTLLMLMIIEFAIALTASILSCQTHNSCCGKSKETGLVIAQQQVIPNNATIPTMHPNQVQNFIAQPVNQPVYYQPNHAQHTGASTNVTITLQPNQNPIYRQSVSQSIYYHPAQANLTLVRPANEQIRELPPAYSY